MSWIWYPIHLSKHQYPKNIFRFIRPVHVHLKTDKVDLKKKPPWKKFFLHFFSIPSSSRHEKRCRMSQRIYCLFQCSRNYLWLSSTVYCTIRYLNSRFVKDFPQCSGVPFLKCLEISFRNSLARQVFTFNIVRGVVPCHYQVDTKL